MSDDTSSHVRVSHLYDELLLLISVPKVQTLQISTVSTNSTFPTENQTTSILTQRNLLQYHKRTHISHTVTQLIDQQVHTRRTSVVDPGGRGGPCPPLAACQSCTWHNIDLLWRTIADFVAPDVWPPNSPDLNLVDYAIWSVIQQRVYKTRVHDIDELRQRLLHVWCNLEQSLIDDAVDQYQHLCVLVFVPETDILNINCGYQFVFPVLNELYALHHAWCSRRCSKSAL